MFIDIGNKFYCKFMKFISKYKNCKCLNWLEFQHSDVSARLDYSEVTLPGNTLQFCNKTIFILINLPPMKALCEKYPIFYTKGLLRQGITSILLHSKLLTNLVSPFLFN